MSGRLCAPACCEYALCAAASSPSEALLRLPWVAEACVAGRVGAARRIRRPLAAWLAQAVERRMAQSCVRVARERAHPAGRGPELRHSRGTHRPWTPRSVTCVPCVASGSCAPPGGQPGHADRRGDPVRHPDGAGEAAATTSDPLPLEPNRRRGPRRHPAARGLPADPFARATGCRRHSRRTPARSTPRCTRSRPRPAGRHQPLLARWGAPTTHGSVGRAPNESLSGRRLQGRHVLRGQPAGAFSPACTTVT